MNSIIKWMAEHPVAANLITVFVIAVGILSVTQMPQKTFPEFSLDAVSVSVSYPGASPLEIQDSIVRPIEDQLSGVDGIDSVTATISEGRGGVVVSFLRGENIAKKLDEIKTEIDRIRVFPDDADEPSVEQASNNSRVLEIALHGDASEAVLKEEAHRLKEELTSLPAISFVEIVNTRDYEVSIELSRDMLRAYGITISEVAQIISQSSLELPGGSIKTNTVAIPIRTTGRNYTQSDFENIIIRTSPDGGRVYLRDIAKVVDGFQDTDLSTNFNGDPSVSINVFRVGDEQVLTIVEEAIDHLDLKFRPTLEDGIDVTVWQNEATNLQDRIDLLVNNAAIGLVLVVLCLALFLDIRLAFWSAFGIGISFTATFIIMSSIGMSINMISLFGFILAIGIVVDNAIVVSENIYTNSEKGMPAMQAAVKGTQRIAIPVVFSALTTIVAFWPLTQLPGVLGKFLTDIPIVVMVVLSLSLVQALIILPRNLSKLDLSPSYRPNLVFKALNLVRSVVDTGLQWFVRVPLDAVLRFTTNGFAILIPIAFAIALMMMTVGLLAFGYVKFNFFPSIDGDFVTASIEMDDGTTFDMTQKVAEDVRLAALKAGSLIQNGLPKSAPSVIVGINVVVGRGVAAGGPGGGTAANGATIANVVVQITDPTQRSWASSEFEAVWRNAIGPVASVKTLSVSAELIGAGAAVAIEMSLPDGDDISPVVADLRENLRKIPGLFSLQDDNSAGRLEFRLALREEARLYGVTLSDLANQTRAGFFGLEATSVQRGADNVSVIVRYPANERDSLSDLLSTWITTPSGDQIPLSTVAKIEEGQAPAQILRRDGRQVTTLTADLDTAISTSSEVKVLIETDLIPKLKAKYNNLILTSGGEQREQADAQAALSQALGIALFIIFCIIGLSISLLYSAQSL